MEYISRNGNKADFTKLSSELELQNKELLGGVQSGMHLVESCRPSGRTESKNIFKCQGKRERMSLGYAPKQQSVICKWLMLIRIKGWGENGGEFTLVGSADGSG